MAQLSGIAAAELVRDADELHGDIEHYDGEAVSLIFKRTFDVDIAPPTWNVAHKLDLDPRLIEQSLRRDCGIVVVTACKLASGTGAAVVRDLARRLLADAVGQTLWAASALAAELPKEEALDLLFGHACCTLRRGSEFVFEQLAELGVDQDRRLASALEAGIITAGTNIACAAADWLAQSPQPDDLLFLYRAYTFWHGAEAPYPSGGGTVPKSPRAKLLQAKLTLEPVPLTVLLELWEDPRHDVRDAVQAAFAAMIQSGTASDEIARAVGEARLPARWLKAVCAELSYLSDLEVDLLCSGFESSAEDYRLALMEVLSSHVGLQHQHEA